MYLGSDALALAHLTDRIVYLEEGDWVEVTAEGCSIHDANDLPVERKVQKSAVSGALIVKGDYRHFMQKEIFEQPTAIGETLASLVDASPGRVVLPALPFDLPPVRRFACLPLGPPSPAPAVRKP